MHNLFLHVMNLGYFVLDYCEEMKYTSLIKIMKQAYPLFIHWLNLRMKMVRKSDKMKTLKKIIC